MRTSPVGRLHFPNVGGLLKKAYELSVLCTAEVELVIFSPAGKLYELFFSATDANDEGEGLIMTSGRFSIRDSEPVEKNQTQASGLGI